jgi:hypothetical protein
MKKLLSVVLSAAMVLSFSSIAFASNVGTVNEFKEAGTVYVGSESENRSANTITGPAGALPARAEDIASVENKSDAPTNKITPLASWTTLSNYQVYNQVTAFNCGPASIQAALRYLNGSTPTIK